MKKIRFPNHGAHLSWGEQHPGWSRRGWIERMRDMARVQTDEHWRKHYATWAEKLGQATT